MAETQPKLQPDFLRLSAMISQYFTVAVFTDPSGPFAVQVCSLDLCHRFLIKRSFARIFTHASGARRIFLQFNPRGCKALEDGSLGLSPT
jgi:hypothetical protein